MSRIGVIGLWHLGCVISAFWASKGKEVIAFDDDCDRVTSLRNNSPPLFEPGLEASIAESQSKGALTFTSSIEDLSACDFVFLAIDTELDEQDRCLLDPLEKTFLRYIRVASDTALVVVCSQLPVGTCGRLRQKLQNEKPQADLVYSPENLRLGQALACYEQPDRIVVGAAQNRSLVRVKDLFATIDAPIVSMNLESAELVKHGINAFLATSVVFGNSLADICEASGAQMSDVVKGMKSDPRIGSRAYINAGTGFSGGTLARDLQALAQVELPRATADLASAKSFFAETYGFNQMRNRSLAERIAAQLPSIPKPKVAILGVTYKTGTSTLRRSAPIEIATALSKKGITVSAYDPLANAEELQEFPQIEIAATLEMATANTDMVVIFSAYPEFREANWEGIAKTMRTPQIFDLAKSTFGEALETIGYKVYVIGEAQSGSQSSS